MRILDLVRSRKAVRERNRVKKLLDDISVFLEDKESVSKKVMLDLKDMVKKKDKKIKG